MSWEPAAAGTQDAISDNVREISAYLVEEKIETVVVLGVHTNMCVLNRSFGIKNLVRWGVDTIPCRDLTDAMYDPTSSPYVFHAERTRLVISFIEKFWCPTTVSDELLASGS